MGIESKGIDIDIDGVFNKERYLMLSYMEKVTKDYFEKGVEYRYTYTPINMSAKIQGGVIYSYDTPICFKRGRTAYLNTTKYSPTTSRQQKHILLYCLSNNIKVKTLEHNKFLKLLWK